MGTTKLGLELSVAICLACHSVHLLATFHETPLLSPAIVVERLWDLPGRCPLGLTDQGSSLQKTEWHPPLPHYLSIISDHMVDISLGQQISLFVFTLSMPSLHRLALISQVKWRIRSDTYFPESFSTRKEKTHHKLWAGLKSFI